MQIKSIPIDKILPNPKNPRIDLRPGMPLYEKLADSMGEFGYIDPIIWNEKTGMIVSGHQRFQVMKDIAERKGEIIENVDVVVVNMNENKQNAFMVAVNKITGLWDNTKLEALFKEMESEDLALTGFEDFEIEALVNCNPIDADKLFEDAEEQGEHKKEPKKIRCPHCGEEFEL